MSSPIAIRDHLIAAVRADLVGPYDLEAADTAVELLELPPSRWYFTGFLATEGSALNDDPEADDEGGAGDDVDDGASSAAAVDVDLKRPRMFPSSLGLSVLVPPGAAGALGVTVRFAEYHPVAEAEAEGESRRRGRVRWKRVPYVVQAEVPLAALAGGVALPGHPKLVLAGRVEPLAEVPGVEDGCQAVAVFLLNQRPVLDARLKDEAWIFQVSLEVRPPAGSQFLARPDPRAAASAELDDHIIDLQLRDVARYGVGHGVAVEDGPAGSFVRTTWVPEGRVLPVRTRSDDAVVTSMDALAALPDGAALTSALLPLVDAYGGWIAAQAQVDVGGGRRAETRDRLVHEAGVARDRIREGIELLGRDAQARKAFCWMNAAMAQAARQRSPERYAGGAVPSWRLFQLAFVLLNVCGIREDDHPDRDRVELIFFPTGGGKTEAYLGVIGFTLLLRRLHGASRPDGGLGVAVLLRYTLRLLTLDQLGRAATLVCALERLRIKRRGELGEVRFAIGLWVGRSATANTMGQVTRAIVEYKSGKGATPFPLTHCPWCREELGPKGLTLKPDVKKPEAVEVACVNHRCDFNQRNGGLPVLFVDEQIYRELPAFVLATVDKFAMLPWRGETGALFGRVHSHDGGRFFGPMDGASPRPGHTPLPSGLLPPELIVQDEVHLIAGPLGTMVGLYEAVIERLCLWETVSGAPRRPKILASTATVRRAGDQMKALFGRSATAIFPPPGVDEGESFFAERDPTAPDRRYLGVAAPGRSFKAVQLRTYVVLLTAAWHQKQRHGAAADPWLSVLGYYNSLRELGGMRRLAEDEVISRAHRADERKPLDAPGPHRWVAQRKLESDPVELTSRESTAKIARAKARLGVPHGDKGAVDVALATNMISVGLDIDRLGLMVVAGQPKTTAEYIQASSRVGRQATRGPGLVVTCLNVYRPRDLSHYEHFGAYHASFYRYVEANSLTPFSAPALDRGLAGVLVALVRLSDPGFTAPRGVEQLPARRAQVDDLLQVLVQRAVNVSNLDQAAIEALEASVALRARTLLDTWEKIVTQAVSDDAGKRCYSGLDRGHNGKALLRMALSDDDEAILSPEELRFIAPTSMRDVEPSIHVWVGFKPEGKS